MTTNQASYHRQINVGENERLASIIGGGALIAWGITKGSWSGFAAALAGGALAFRGASGHCDMYQALGIHTDQRSGRNVSVPYELGIRVDHSITVRKPQDEVYRYWRNLENLPKFMEHLESVTEIDNKDSHWVARAPIGTTVQWKAEIINEKESELIAWRSLPGSDVPNAGSVQFKPAPDGGGTIVTVALQYDPPAGSLGALFARIIGQNPSNRILEDLRRFKQLMETGEIQTSSGQMAGHRQLARDAARKPAPKKGWNRDVVDTASEDSFPASDPPSWTPTSGVSSS